MYPRYGAWASWGLLGTFLGGAGACENSRRDVAVSDGFDPAASSAASTGAEPMSAGETGSSTATSGSSTSASASSTGTAEGSGAGSSGPEPPSEENDGFGYCELGDRYCPQLECRDSVPPGAAITIPIGGSKIGWCAFECDLGRGGADCPAPLGGTAQPRCDELSGDGPGRCVLACPDDATCPEGSVPYEELGSCICVYDASNYA